MDGAQLSSAAGGGARLSVYKERPQQVPGVRLNKREETAQKQGVVLGFF